MTEPWNLTDSHKHILVLSGMTEDKIAVIEAERAKVYDEIREELYGEDSEKADRHFYEKYGFEHVCTCVNDKFTGNVVEKVPVCTLEMGDKALEHLTKVLQERDMLAIEVEDLRREVKELRA